ncbi:MAG: hypothetical protein QXG91_03885 [Candidatus Aenigmatarchaeota archaeon]
MKIPKLFKKYFWEVDLRDINLKKHQAYIIERLLEYGDEKAFKWLLKNFDLKEVLEIARKSKKISPKTKNFLNLIFR